MIASPFLTRDENMNASRTVGLGIFLVVGTGVAWLLLSGDKGSFREPAGSGMAERVAARTLQSGGQTEAVDRWAEADAGDAHDDTRSVHDISPVISETNLLGTVKQTTGEPVGDAAVALFSGILDVQYGEDPLAETRTNADGLFVFEDLEQLATVIVRIIADGYGTHSVRALVGTHEEVWLQPSSQLTGRVMDKNTGLGIEGVRLSHNYSVNNNDLVYETEAISRSDGSYSLAYEIGKSVALGVEREGYSYDSRDLLLTEPGESYDVYLETHQVARGRLIDAATGSPISGSVHQGWNSRPITTTNLRGEFAVAVQLENGNEPDTNLVFFAPDYCTVRCKVPFRQDQELLVIPMVRRVKVCGVVQTSEGVSLAGASVNAGDPFARRDGSDFASFVRDPPETWQARRWSVPASTDRDGRFEVETFPSTRPIRVTADHPEYPEATIEIRPQSPGQVVEVVLECPVGGEIAGRITAQGKPCFARVFCHQQGNLIAYGTTNELGFFRRAGTSLATGELSVSVVPGGEWITELEEFPELRQTIPVTDASTVRFEFDLPIRFTSVSGTVSTPTGAPIAGVQVWIEAEAPPYWQRSYSHSDGSFEFTVMQLQDREPGLSLGARRREQSVKISHVKLGSTDNNIVLPDLGRLRLVLKDATTHKPLRWCDAALAWRSGSAADAEFVEYEGRDWGSLCASPDGSFLIELPLGTVDLRLTFEDHRYAPALLSDVSVGPHDHPLEVLAKSTARVRIQLVNPEIFHNERMPLVLLLREEARDQVERVDRQGEQTYRINGVILRVAREFSDSESFGERVIWGGDRASTKPTELRLAPGAYQLLAFPDTVQFDPAEIAVGFEDANEFEITATPR